MKKNLVVIGIGGMGYGYHVAHALKSDCVNLLGVYDKDAAKLEKAHAEGIHTYRSLEEVLSDGAVDLITVATPNDSHLEAVLRCLNAGKNVICEKPVALSVADFDKMTAAAEKSGKIFSVHQNRRWDVDYLGMKHIIDHCLIGDVLRIESRIHGSRGVPSDWRRRKQQGGGMIFDWGVHLIDQMLLLIDSEIDTVSCNCTNITTREVDDGFRLTLCFKDGKTAYIEVGTYNFIPLPRFYMQGSDGTAIITDWTKKAQIVKCKAWHESDVLPVQSASGLTKTMAPRDDMTTDTFTIDIPKSDVHDFYRNICCAIDGTQAPTVQWQQVRKVLLVMEAAFASHAEKGMPIKFE